MNEKAEGHLISFFRFNKSPHPPSPFCALFISTILFPMTFEQRVPLFFLSVPSHGTDRAVFDESRCRMAVRKKAAS